MLKSLLKTILPPKALRSTLNLYHTVKRNTLDRLLFPKEKIAESAFRIYDEKNPFLELNIPMNDFPAIIRTKLSLWTDPEWLQDQYLLIYDRSGYIEPVTGWAMTPSHNLIYPSLGFSGAPQVPRPGIYSSYIHKAKIVQLQKILSLRDTGEENYFHFFNDILPKLYFVRDQGISANELTIVVSATLWKKEYFQTVITRVGFNTLKWYVQENEWVSFASAVFCKPYTHTGKYLREAVNALIPSSPPGNKRIFLNRNSSGQRYIINMDEIAPVLKRHGFEIVDSASMKFSDQVDLFYSCSYLIGIHGAGMTNMMFRGGNPLKVLEIAHPFEYIPFHYIMLAREFNFEYDVILGYKSSVASNDGFTVDPVLLEQKIQTTP